MKLYADAPGRRARQLLGDLLVLAWVWAWTQVALVVRSTTLALAEPGREVAEAGSGLAGQLAEAGRTVEAVPLVGAEVRRPFDGAAAAAQRIAEAGTAQAEAVESLAFWLALAVLLVPALTVLGFYLPLRWRFVRAATVGRRYVDGTEDLDLLALRALARQPLHRLVRLGDDPAAAWRRGDPAVVRHLAGLELRDCGLSVPDPPDSRRVAS